MVDLVLQFLNNSVFPVERCWARCCFLHTRGFDAWTNTKLEGCNLAVKCSETHVRPDMGMAESTKTLLTQDEEKRRNKAKAVATALKGHRLCTDSTTADHLAKEAEGDLQREFSMRHHHASKRLSPSEWQVLFMGKRSHGKHQPNFERVRSVCIRRSGELHCSCGHPSQWGIPCRHTAHVLEFCFDDQDCFLPDDVDLRCHNLHSSMVACKVKSDLPPEQLELRKQLISLRRSSPIQMPMARGTQNSLSAAIGDETGSDFPGSVSEHIENMAKCAPICSSCSKEAIDRVLKKHILGDSFITISSGTRQQDSNFDLVDQQWGSFSPDQKNSPEMSLHEVIRPCFKELNQLCDGASPETEKRVCSELEQMVQAARTKRALNMGGDAPTGKRVSGKTGQKNASGKHKKQRTH